MRKKTILGKYIKKDGVHTSYSIKKLKGEFEGYSALIEFLPGSEELIVEFNGKKTCLAAPGYKRLVYLPMKEKWGITTFINDNDEAYEWYFDISKENFIDEDGMPCTDDIFLDFIVMANGDKFTVDEDELKEAYDKGEISIDDYNFAYQIRDEIIESKWNNISYLKNMSEKLLLDYK